MTIDNEIALCICGHPDCQECFPDSALRQKADAAYLERNQVVAALAKCFPSGTKQTAIEGWDKEWHGCVFIDLPTGQASWHYHDSHAHLFAGLPEYQGVWDGHTTPEKYERLAGLRAGTGIAEKHGNIEGEKT